MHNEKCHLAFCFTFKVGNGMQLYDYILEIGVKNYKESVVMVDLLAMIDCACDI